VGLGPPGAEAPGYLTRVQATAAQEAAAPTPGVLTSTLRCPDTARHRRFYERLGFVAVARLPRYYHGHDFVEYLREPLVQVDSGAR
jgi:hypothetical protein